MGEEYEREGLSSFSIFTFFFFLIIDRILEKNLNLNFKKEKLLDFVGFLFPFSSIYQITLILLLSWK